VIFPDTSYAYYLPHLGTIEYVKQKAASTATALVTSRFVAFQGSQLRHIWLMTFFRSNAPLSILTNAGCISVSTSRAAFRRVEWGNCEERICPTDGNKLG
jgi:hypothetical protein